MNKRQAKIQALSISVGVLRSTADNYDWQEFNDDEADKIVKEILNIADALDWRVFKLTVPKTPNTRIGLLPLAINQ